MYLLFRYKNWNPVKEFLPLNPSGRRVMRAFMRKEIEDRMKEAEEGA